MELKIVKGYSLVLAADQKMGIGKEGQLPWDGLKRDFRNFVRATRDAHTEEKRDMPMFFQAESFFEDTKATAPLAMKNAVVMGSKTYMSIPAKNRPLSDRYNVVLTRDVEKFKNGLNSEEKNSANIRVFDDFIDMFTTLDSDPTVREIVVIGGAEITKK